MSLTINDYTPQLEPLVKAFNKRLKDNGVFFQFPEIHTSLRWPEVDGRKFFERFYVAVEDNTAVRGAYKIKHQDFHVKNENISIGNIQLPLSEGTFNKAYNMVGFKLVKDALARQPAIYALGMGGMGRPFPRLLESMGWTLATLPFYFLIVNPYRFAKNIAVLRTSKAGRILFDFLAYTGLAWLGVIVLQSLHRQEFTKKRVTTEEVAEFGHWADEVWNLTKGCFLFCAVRDAQTLNIMYPKSNDGVTRLKMMSDNRVVGWVLLSFVPETNHKFFFGEMQVCYIVDLLSLNGYERSVIRAVLAYLKKHRIDLIVSNQSYGPYVGALKGNGFLKGPSNFILGTSRKLTELLKPLNANLTHIHLNRGDGDGP